MITRWRERRREIDKLAPSVSQIIRNHPGLLDAESKNYDDLGTLVDLAALASQEANVDESPSLSRLAELHLSTTRDFKVVHTLSAQDHIESFVRVVSAPGLGTSKRIYVLKSLAKAAAEKLYGQTSIQYERDVLIAGTTARTAFIPHLVAALQDESKLELILEYLPAGDLGLLLEERKVFSEACAKAWLAETLVAIEWLHQLGFAHRDIKPANLLLTLDGHVKLTDFASAAPLVVVGKQKMVRKDCCSAPVGTVDYIAPDILLAHETMLEEASFDLSLHPEGPGGYSASVDLWSCGVMLYEMITGTLPFFADSIPDTYEKIVYHEKHLRFDPTHRWSATAEHLVRGLLATAGNRLSIGDITYHSYFSGLDWNALISRPGPLRPPIRQLTVNADTSTVRQVTKVFDFSALFSSPGLSILRPDKDDNDGAIGRWIGFTHLPEGGEFDARTDDIAENRLLQPSPHENASMHPVTPARTSVSPHGAVSSSKRRMQNMEALQELVAHGILKTAKKASASSQRKQIPPEMREAAPPAALATKLIRPNMQDLEQRQKKLIGDVTEIERKYADLFKRAQALQ